MVSTDSRIDQKLLEHGRKLFELECRFVAGATSIDVLPPPNFPEIAFAGRSNVGKSSLINALTRHNALARTSRTPGRTQQINFFELRNSLMLVDLPGYGYARASKKKISTWTDLIHAYILGRPNLRRLCLLIDSRHGIKNSDIILMTELDTAAVVYQFVLTKTDKISEPTLTALIRDIENMFPQHPAAHPEIMGTSSQTGNGIEALRVSLATLAATDQFR